MGRAKAAKEAWTADQVVDALRSRYAEPAFALLQEVRDGTGTSTVGRSADVLVMSLWPSRGLHLHGFEVKVSRSDWLKEYRDPAKADAIKRYCDFWWLAAGAAGIALDSELPADWGLLVPSGSGLRVAKDAPSLTPEPISRLFLASLMREIEKLPYHKLSAEYARGRKDGESSERKRYDDLLNRVREFETASGVSVSTSWDSRHIGDAVKMVLRGEHLRARESLQHLRRSTAGLLKCLDEALGEPDVPPPTKQETPP